MAKPYKWNKYAYRVVVFRVKPFPPLNRVNNKVGNIPADSASKATTKLVAGTITIHPAVALVGDGVEDKEWVFSNKSYRNNVLSNSHIHQGALNDWMNWTETMSFSNWNIVNSSSGQG